MDDLHATKACDMRLHADKVGSVYLRARSYKFFPLETDLNYANPQKTQLQAGYLHLSRWVEGCRELKMLQVMGLGGLSGPIWKV